MENTGSRAFVHDWKPDNLAGDWVPNLVRVGMPYALTPGQEPTSYGSSENA